MNFELKIDFRVQFFFFNAVLWFYKSWNFHEYFNIINHYKKMLKNSTPLLHQKT